MPSPVGVRDRSDTLPDDVLTWARGRAGLVIELKLGPIWYPGIEDALLTTVQQHEAEAEVLVISFDHFAVQRVKQLDSRMKTAIMYGGRPLDAVAMARAAGADAVRPSHDTLTAQDVAVCHAAGLAAGTPDQPALEATARTGR